MNARYGPAASNTAVHQQDTARIQQLTDKRLRTSRTLEAIRYGPLGRESAQNPAAYCYKRSIGDTNACALAEQFNRAADNRIKSPTGRLLGLPEYIACLEGDKSNCLFFAAGIIPVGKGAKAGNEAAETLSRLGDDAAEAGVFGRVAATQGPRDVGSALPKSFNLRRSTGEDVWVNPNATKHMWEETRGLTFGRGIAEQQRLTGLADAVDGAVVGRWGQVQVSRGWELIFEPPRTAGMNPVLKHARYLGGRG